MKVAIMQPYLFPYIGYWQLINSVDTFVIFDDVNFIKKGFINRNNILIQGKKKRITLQLIKASQNKLINETDIGKNTSELLNTIRQSYKKAPYFNKVEPLIKRIFIQEEKNLAKFIGFSLDIISRYLDIQTNYIYSSDIEKDNSLKGQEKIIEICKFTGADTYINAIGGQALYDRKVFKESAIELNFLRTSLTEYSQFNIDFIPNLSVIDLLMFNSQQDLKIMLNNYELI